MARIIANTAAGKLILFEGSLRGRRSFGTPDLEDLGGEPVEVSPRTARRIVKALRAEHALCGFGQLPKDATIHVANPKPTKVHIRDTDGRLLFTRLWDDGSLVLEFDSGHGFVDRLDVDRAGWQVVDGWVETGN